MTEQLPARQNFAVKLHEYFEICELIDIELTKLDDLKSSFKPYLEEVTSHNHRKGYFERVNMRSVRNLPDLVRLQDLHGQKRSSLSGLEFLWQQLTKTERKSFNVPEFIKDWNTYT